MASGSISEPPLSRDSTKKKRTHGSAKLKQIKLDVRREQWLSRVNKGFSADFDGRLDYCPSSNHISSEENGSSNKEFRGKRGEDIEGSCIPENYLGSVINGSTQSTFDHDVSGNGFSERSSSSGSMGTSVSGNVSEEEEDDGCLDDWEAAADALNADDGLHSVVSESPAEHEWQFCDNVTVVVNNTEVDFSKTKLRSAISVSHPNCQAWKPNDACRPQCLPNLSKQHSSSLNSDWHGNHKTVPQAWQPIISQPSQCPICYEDLDVTDSSFLPCPCGFHLCLFCHKKILEADGRCPGCRKLYDHEDRNGGLSVRAEAFHITQSCSMSTWC